MVEVAEVGRRGNDGGHGRDVEAWSRDVSAPQVRSSESSSDGSGAGLTKQAAADDGDGGDDIDVADLPHVGGVLRANNWCYTGLKGAVRSEAQGRRTMGAINARARAPVAVTHARAAVPISAPS